MQFQMVLNEPDAGEISVNLNDPKAIDITQGRLIKMVYRGAPIGSGAFFVENVVDDLAASGDRGGQWKKVSGRGGLAILDDAIVWSTTDTSRTFTAKPMGEILLTLITEAKARGCFPTMRTEFSAALDSDGEAWTDSTTITLQTGTSLLDVARQFADLGIEFKLIFDWVLEDYALYAYGSATGTDKSDGVVVQMGHNAEQLSETQESSALKNAFLVSYQAGITNVTDATSIAAYRRREAFFQAGNAPSSGSALVLANAELAARKDPTHSITVQLNDGANPPGYGVDYDLGDWIGVDWADGTVPESYRIRGITLDWPEGRKYATITLTLNSLKLEQELRTAIAMRKIANGSLGSGTSSAPPNGNAAVDAHDADAAAHSNRTLSGDLGGTLGAPDVTKIQGIAVKDGMTPTNGQVLVFNGTNSEAEFSSVPSHAGSHQSGGGDAIKLDDMAAPDDNTDLNVSTTAHGLVPKLPNDAAKYLNGIGGFTIPAGGSGGSSIYPQAAMLTPLQFVITSGGGSLNIAVTTSQILNLLVNFSTVSNGDAMQSAVVLAAGTYDVLVFGKTDNNKPKVDWSLDGVDFITGQDWYSASSVFNVKKTGTVTVSDSGRHLLKVTVNGKNASSSGYVFTWTAIVLTAQTLSTET